MYRPLAILIIPLVLSGCATREPYATTQPSTQSSAPSFLRPAALLNGGALEWQTLQTPLVEAAGGQVLQEIVLGRLLQDRLAQRGLTITDAQIEQEQQILAQTFNSDPKQAARLLSAVRKRRGLGDQRFRSLLWRNAALRLLVQDEVQVTDLALRQAFDEAYGPLYVTRLITASSMEKAGEVLRRVRAGESFIDLAVELSTDSSSKQGGLLPAISTADPTYPQALRSLLPKLKPGQVSDPIVLESNFAILRLERIIEPVPVKFDEVKQELTDRVRRRIEQALMQRQARQLLSQAEVLVLDPALAEVWKQQREAQQE
jgi:parvulin-like peptidyl-prolyl isomerase